jgi:hypothetical protein
MCCEYVWWPSEWLAGYTNTNPTLHLSLKVTREMYRAAAAANATSSLAVRSLQRNLSQARDKLCRFKTKTDSIVEAKNQAAEAKGATRELRTECSYLVKRYAPDNPNPTQRDHCTRNTHALNLG